MPTISLAIQKGGSGKTTTAINLAAALRDLQYQVLLIDLDPQANLTQALGIQEEPTRSIYHLLKEASTGQESNIEELIDPDRMLDIVPASLELANAELELVSIFGRENLLARLLQPLKKKYDYIFIDCPPALAMLTVNALVASDYVLMPLQAEFLPLNGVNSFMRSIDKLRTGLNLKIETLGVILTKYDKRKIMNRDVLQQLEENYEDLVFKTRIRSNIALAKAQEKGLDIFTYKQNSNGAKDYAALATEFLGKIAKT